MKCPFCGFEESKVVNSRRSREGNSIRRRRECAECRKRFTTHEVIENIPLFVIKKDGRREAFAREKIIKGLIRACEKRDVGYERIEEIASAIEKSLYNEMTREVSAKKIGDMIMKRLRELDEVAYIRFASVYLNFKEVSEFAKEVKTLINK
ncbi:MAG TPA: transcriptional regulator NrdR [Candidatus Sumerlaeota bacterium]|nr:MAG: Transcriptional repressor NrdR [candidate division BRC1 bacterium ADurb.Bin183]HOE64421.1 transcriptional regulator NrdR [Candidatus Sumerlaeota bacterium]HRR32129.1 transcriptional regulator NrdR [Candidatus Sumerlaeia bacterium]HON49797.1 transcriptional regulator NrdR [Candidatus Sumerlaeota bacterium]HOR63955.1 transcriptional regulator NrdR [Candidatus Sumerlaeota bacterium]